MKTNIGGQAVIEGVYMRGSTSSALAVRDNDGKIRVETSRILKKRSKFAQLPFIRGIVALGDSLFTGTKTLLKAAEVVGEDELDTSATSDKKMNALLMMSVFLGLALSVGLFLLLPNVLTTWLIDLTKWVISPLAKNMIEGVIKLIILISYMLLVSTMKDIKRVFMYHGAEHKTINCYEKGLPLTVGDVQTCSTIHDRCGTSFTVYVVLISIIIAIFFGWSENIWIRLAVRLLTVLPVASISYELLKLLSRTDSKWVKPLKWFGWQMQKITTKQPDDEMVEVAIAAFDAVLQLEKDKDMAVQSFPSKVKLDVYYNQCLDMAKQHNVDQSDVDWLLCEVLRIKRAELTSDKAKDIPVAFGLTQKIDKMLQYCCSGMPLQYVLGNTDFYGYRLKITPSVLIPRMETELLTEQVVKYCKTKSRAKVLDLCCGSGAIAIVVAKKTSAKVMASDISQAALRLTKENTLKHKARVDTRCSDMFGSLEGKFDVIVSNPPYIKTADLAGLEDKVKEFEPLLALDGGEDGLVCYRKIAADADKFLTDKGVLMLEVGIGQADDVKEMLNDKYDVKILNDYNSIPRIIIAQLR